MQLHSSLVIIQLFGNSFKFEKKLHLDFIKKIFSQSAHSFSEKTEREREREREKTATGIAESDGARDGSGSKTKKK